MMNSIFRLSGEALMAAKLPLQIHAISSFELYFLEVGKKLPASPTKTEDKTGGTSKACKKIQAQNPSEQDIIMSGVCFFIGIVILDVFVKYTIARDLLKVQFY